MRRSIQLLLILVLLSPAVGRAGQVEPLQNVLVTSWKKGDERVYERTVRVSLDAGHKQYHTIVRGLHGRKYRLRVVHNPLTNLKLEHWHIELREILRNRKLHTTAVGDDLISMEGSSPAGDYFPRGDLVGYLYPRATYDFMIGGSGWTDGRPFYPIGTVRRIRIEGFFLIATVTSWQMSLEKPKQVEFLNLLLEFQNAEPGK